MKPQRWQEIDGIFAAALERGPPERTAFLAEACGVDEELRKEVESLLAHDSPDSLVGKQAVQEAIHLLLPARTSNCKTNSSAHIKSSDRSAPEAWDMSTLLRISA